MGPGIPSRKAELGAEVSDLIGTVSRRVRMAANRELDPLGVTSSQVRALRVLARLQRPTRMSELADALHIARRSATSVIDELAEHHCVERSPDPNDRRGVTVSVTAAGHALLRELAERRRAVTTQLTSTLSRDELRQLRDLLARIQDQAI